MPRAGRPTKLTPSLISKDRRAQCSQNSMIDKPRPITHRYAPPKKTNRLQAQSKIDQDSRVSLPWPTSSLALASVRHSLSRSSRPKHPIMKSILSERLISSNCSSVICPDGSTYSSQKPKLQAISEYVGEFIQSVLNVIKSFLKRYTKNLGYMSIGLAAGVKGPMLFLLGINNNVFDTSGPSFGRPAFY